jgi:DNA-directed RNA polymerase subunit N (RpoN/RPB10)
MKQSQVWLIVFSSSNFLFCFVNTNSYPCWNHDMWLNIPLKTLSSIYQAKQMMIGVRESNCGERLAYYYKRYFLNDKSSLAKKNTSLKYFDALGLDVDVQTDKTNKGIVLQGLRVYNQGLQCFLILTFER